jgi:hypothetical protein
MWPFLAVWNLFTRRKRTRLIEQVIAAALAER